MKKVLLFSILSVLMFSIVQSQSLSNVRYEAMTRPEFRKEIRIPNLPGYLTLKCDFHMHTVFSDGTVWPTVRVEEAWMEGLDAIAITDHIENQPSKNQVKGDHNSSYEIAEKSAKSRNLILIRAGEITRQMPPGHLNAIFLNDVNKLDVKEPTDALRAAREQGAFIIWNHPGWKAQQPDTCRWMPMHEELLGQRLINGIEVFNEVEYYPVVLDWCLEKKVAVIADSDIHDLTAQSYDLENGYRPMTLVFAKERTAESIREALFAGRTLALFNDRLAGQDTLLSALFRESVRIERHPGDDKEYFLTNSTIIPFTLLTARGNEVVIPAGGTVITHLEKADLRGVNIRNLYTGSRSCLKVDLESCFR